MRVWVQIKADNHAIISLNCFTGHKSATLPPLLGLVAKAGVEVSKKRAKLTQLHLSNSKHNLY